MTCKQFDKLLVDFVDGNLSKRKMNEALAHAERCDTCKSALDDYQKMIAKLNRVPKQSCPDSVIDTVLDAVPATETSWLNSLTKRFAHGRAWKISFVAAFAIFVISIILFDPQSPPVVEPDHEYTQEEIARAKLEVQLALGYFHRYARKAENAIEEQVLAKGVVEPVSSSIKIAFKPILNGGSK